eukprot:snap_masked-scaffold_4-processed-gene-19.40-mRNA-1 protein AED:1.00 eAED:1.00 QI:0/-1/0/0/-1/1/1/0/346
MYRFMSTTRIGNVAKLVLRNSAAKSVVLRSNWTDTITIPLGESVAKRHFPIEKGVLKLNWEDINIFPPEETISIPEKIDIEIQDKGYSGHSDSLRIEGKLEGDLNILTQANKTVLDKCRGNSISFSGKDLEVTKTLEASSLSCDLNNAGNLKASKLMCRTASIQNAKHVGLASAFVDHLILSCKSCSINNFSGKLNVWAENDVMLNFTGFSFLSQDNANNFSIQQKIETKDGIISIETPEYIPNTFEAQNFPLFYLSKNIKDIDFLPDQFELLSANDSKISYILKPIQKDDTKRVSQKIPSGKINLAAELFEESSFQKVFVSGSPRTKFHIRQSSWMDKIKSKLKL